MKGLTNIFNFKRNTLLILLITFIVLLLCSCSNIAANVSENDVSSILQPKTSQSTFNIIQNLIVNVDEKGENKNIYLLNDNNILKIKIENNILTLGNIAADMDEKYVVKVLVGEDNKKYILVYKYFLIGSPSGEEDHLYLIKYTNKDSMEILWNGNLPEYKFEYIDKKIRLTFVDSNKVIEGDISNIVKSMEAQKERVEPLTLNEFFNGKVIFGLTDVESQDYNGDGYDEIITKHDVFNEELCMYLSSIYTIWSIKNDNVYIYKRFTADIRSPEIVVINGIVENGYLNYDKLDSLFDGENYSEYLNQLVRREVIKIQNSKVIFK